MYRNIYTLHKDLRTYLKADFFKLCVDLFHQTHVPAVDKVLPTPLLQKDTQRNIVN